MVNFSGNKPQNGRFFTRAIIVTAVYALLTVTVAYADTQWYAHTDGIRIVLEQGEDISNMSAEINGVTAEIRADQSDTEYMPPVNEAVIHLLGGEEFALDTPYTFSVSRDGVTLASDTFALKSLLEEDFSDGNYDRWELTLANGNAFIPPDGHISVVDGALKVSQPTTSFTEFNILSKEFDKQQEWSEYVFQFDFKQNNAQPNFQIFSHLQNKRPSTATAYLLRSYWNSANRFPINNGNAMVLQYGTVQNQNDIPMHGNWVRNEVYNYRSDIKGNVYNFYFGGKKVISVTEGNAAAPKKGSIAICIKGLPGNDGSSAAGVAYTIDNIKVYKALRYSPVTSNPASGSDSVPIDEKIDLFFEKTLDLSTVNTNTISVKTGHSDVEGYTITPHQDGKGLTIGFEGMLEYKQEYTVDIGTAVRFVGDDTQYAFSKVQFTTEPLPFEITHLKMFDDTSELTDLSTFDGGILSVECKMLNNSITEGQNFVAMAALYSPEESMISLFGTKECLEVDDEPFVFSADFEIEGALEPGSRLVMYVWDSLSAMGTIFQTDTTVPFGDY